MINYVQAHRYTFSTIFTFKHNIHRYINTELTLPTPTMERLPFQRLHWLLWKFVDVSASSSLLCSPSFPLLHCIIVVFLQTLCNYRNVSEHSIGTINGFVARIVDVLDSGIRFVVNLTLLLSLVWEIGFQFIHELVLRDYTIVILTKSSATKHVILRSAMCARVVVARYRQQYLHGDDFIVGN